MIENQFRTVWNPGQLHWLNEQFRWLTQRVLFWNQSGAKSDYWQELFIILTWINSLFLKYTTWEGNDSVLQQDLSLLAVVQWRITGLKLKRRLKLFCIWKGITAQQMHNLKIHFSPWIRTVLSQLSALCWGEDGKNERVREGGQREYIRLHARESNYLWHTLCISHHQDRRALERGENGKWKKTEEKRGKREDGRWGGERRDTVASQFCLCLLIRLIWVSIVPRVRPRAWNVNFFTQDVDLLSVAGRGDVLRWERLLYRGYLQ